MTARLKVLKVVHQRRYEVRANGASQKLIPGKWKRLVVLAETQQQSLVFKLFSPGTWPRRFYYQLCLREPYQHTFALHKRVKESPIRTVEAHCRGQVRDNGLLSYSFIAMEPLGEAVSTEEYIERFLSRNTTENNAKTHVVRWMAKRLAAMHDSGFFHDDIKPYHIFVDNKPDSIWVNPEDTSDWIWIDLDGSLFSKELSLQQRVVNLSQFSRYFLDPMGVDCLDEFLSTYSELTNGRLPELSTLKQLVQKRSEKRLKRQARSYNL